MRPEIILLIATAALAAPRPLHHLKPALPRAVDAMVFDPDAHVVQRNEVIANPARLHDTPADGKHEDSGGDAHLDEGEQSSVLLDPCQQFLDQCQPMIDPPCVIL